MTLGEAEALYHLAQHYYDIAAHGQKGWTGRWRDEAAKRVLIIENAMNKAAQLSQIKGRTP